MICNHVTEVFYTLAPPTFPSCLPSVSCPLGTSPRRQSALGHSPHPRRGTDSGQGSDNAHSYIVTPLHVPLETTYK